MLTNLCCISYAAPIIQPPPQSHTHITLEQKVTWNEEGKTNNLRDELQLFHDTPALEFQQSTGKSSLKKEKTQ